MRFGVLQAPGRPARRPGARAARCLALVAAATVLLSGTEPAAADDSIPTAWQLQAGTAGLLTAPPPADPATICIIDTGVTPTPDLHITARSSTLPGTLDDVTAKPGQPGHGTTVAHFAAAAVNGWGGAGAFPHARISSVRVFPEEGGTDWQAYIRAFDRCQRLDGSTKVVVLPLGGPALDGREREELENRIASARRDLGLNVVVSAGNGGDAVDFPGRFEDAFTVAGHDDAGSLCGFTAYGPEVDIYAPGCGLEVAGWAGERWSVNGTSFAAPIAAGVLAALRSYRPDLTAVEAETIVRNAARPGRIPMLDARASLTAAGIPAGTVALAQVSQAMASQHVPPTALGPQEPRARPYESPPVASPPDPRTHRASPRNRPRVHVRRSRQRVMVRVLNRPPRALIEWRVGTRRLYRRSSRITVLVSSSRLIRVRFVEELWTSPWTPIR